MGSDDRDAPGNNIDNLTGGGKRSDTTILLHLSADRKRAYGVSIPRDSLVDRPDCKDEDLNTIPGASDVMWNEAFSVGGPACTVQQVEKLTGVRIDHFVVVDFAGFRGMVDAIGGVQVCIPEPIVDPAHGINLPAGTRKLKGIQALNYVRERYVVGDGSDIGRMKRQQAFIASMAHQVISANTLANPIRLVQFLEAATQSLTLDKGLDNLAKIADLGAQFKDIGLDKIQFITVPWQYAPEDPNRIRWLPGADVGLAVADRRQADPTQVPRRRDQRAAAARLTHADAVRVPDEHSFRYAVRDPERHAHDHAEPDADRGALRGSRPQRVVRMTTSGDGPDDGRDESAPEGDEARRRRLAEVFGDVLPDTTSDERDPSRPTSSSRRATSGTATRCRRTTADHPDHSVNDKPDVPLGDVERFLVSRHGRPIESLAPLPGGFWSAAYAYRVGGQDLVLRLGTIPEGFEADRAAMAFSAPTYPCQRSS